MNKAVRKVVIVGGGTAGWLTAAILAAEHKSKNDDGVEITLIESANTPTIGVGEGTWPTMRETLSSIGIKEADFFACCDAAFKQGSKFSGWRNELDTEGYYHPFVAPVGFGESDLVNYWQNNIGSQSFADALSFQPSLCEHYLAPKQFQTPEYAAVANYGYHLDAGKFAKLLEQHSTSVLGVKHIIADVVLVANNERKAIHSLTLDSGELVAGDLFVDCSGSKALLIGEHYKIPFLGQKHVLFNDRALAVQVPHVQENSEILPYTLSTAHDAGWIWDIGLPNRRGVGCVYASDFFSSEQAKDELLKYLSKTVEQPILHSLTIKELAFEPGYRQEFWHQNCVAVGMSAGFIEPLEASAIALIELSAKMIAKELPANHSIMPITAARFNKRFKYRWQRIIEFLKLHYVLSERQSNYWQKNRSENTIPGRLAELLTLWQYQEPTYNDFTEIEEIFPAASYQYILYGMGFKTANRITSRRYNNENVSRDNVALCQQLKNKYKAGLPTHRALIDYLSSRSSFK